MTDFRCAVILGYGIPRDILVDGNYRKYLQAAHDVINRDGITHVVFCGGHTNIHHPEKSEAGEMQRLFEKIHDDHFAMLQKELDKLLDNANDLPVEQILYMRRELEQMQAAFLRAPIHYLCLSTSITSFENIAGLDICMTVNNFVQAIVFCEKTRRFKIRLLCKKLLSPDKSANVISIDFDASRTWRKDAKQVADYFLSWAQLIFPEIGVWRNARQRRHIKRVSQK